MILSIKIKIGSYFKIYPKLFYFTVLTFHTWFGGWFCSDVEKGFETFGWFCIGEPKLMLSTNCLDNSFWNESLSSTWTKVQIVSVTNDKNVIII